MGGGTWGQTHYEGTGGVKPMAIGGRTVAERERTSGMTETERAWRRKWLDDQRISKEPKVHYHLEKEMINPIRRFYRWPLDFVFLRLASPAIGMDNAKVLRFYVGRICLGIWMAMGVHYYFKYNTNTWERRGGWRVIQNEAAVYPGDPGYPHVARERAPHEYYDRGFSQSIFAKNYPQYQNQPQDQRRLN